MSFVSRLSRPSPAAIVACLALLVALSGTGIAGVSALVPRNSVGTTELKNNAVTGVKVKDGSLAAKDFRAGQIPAGPTGPAGAAGAAGPPGPAGAPGATKAIIKTAGFSVPGGGYTGQAVVCPQGAIATGGGVTTAVGLGGNLLLSHPGSAAAGPYNHPNDGDTPVSWYVLLQNTSAYQVEATAYAVCVSP
jgi:hypothetical protein